MARKKTATPKHVDPQDESREAPDGQEGHGRTAPASKADAVRRALAAGFEGPQEGTAFIRKEFGIEMAPQHFSAVKSQLKKNAAGAPKGKPGRKPRAAVEGYLAPPPAPPKIIPTGEGDLIDVLEKMKPLIALHGAEKIKRLVDLLG